MAKENSFDIASKVDLNEVSNALHQTRRFWATQDAPESTGKQQDQGEGDQD